MFRSLTLLVAAPACALATLLAVGCDEHPVAPDRAGSEPRQLAAAAAAPIQLANGGTSSTIFAKAISPDGWILGNFYLASGGPTRAQAWSPYPDLALATITDTGSIDSGTNGHGDVTAYINKVIDYGPAVYFADPVTKGQPYTVVYLPDRPSDGPRNMNAFAINDDHVVVGWTIGSAALLWLPTAPGARSWNEPVNLPVPAYPGGFSCCETQALGINNNGLVIGRVGEIKNNSHVHHALLWRLTKNQDGTWAKPLSVAELPKYPRSAGHRADDINDAGVIAGIVELGKGETPALWFPDASGNYTSPPTVLTGINDWAIGKLNRCGWVAFTSMGRSTTEAYVWNGTTAVLLPHLTGASGGRGNDVSDQGDVVGMARVTPKNESSYGVAVLWRGAVPACP